MAIDIMEPASEIDGQRNTLTVRRVLGHRGVTGNEIADTFAKKAASEKVPDKESRKTMKRTSASFFKR